jgi:hypothetical protein
MMLLTLDMNINRILSGEKFFATVLPDAYGQWNPVESFEG